MSEEAQPEPHDSTVYITYVYTPWFGANASSCQEYVSSLMFVAVPAFCHIQKKDLTASLHARPPNKRFIELMDTQSSICRFSHLWLHEEVVAVPNQSHQGETGGIRPVTLRHLPSKSAKRFWLLRFKSNTHEQSTCWDKHGQKQF